MAKNIKVLDLTFVYLFTTTTIFQEILEQQGGKGEKVVRKMSQIS